MSARILMATHVPQLLLCIVFASPALSAAEREPVQAGRPVDWWASDKQVNQWIDDLAASSYATRKDALIELSKQPRSIIPNLLEAAQTSGPEQSRRLIALLNRFHTSKQSASVDDAERALRTLAKMELPDVSGLAASLLQKNALICESRAAAEIVRMGGLVQHSGSNDRRFMVAPNGMLVQMTEDDRFADRVVIGTAWRGGDEGIRQITRMPAVKVAFIIKGSGVSQDMQDWLQRNTPDLEIEQRGKAFLGVSMHPNAQGCEVIKISPGSAAEKAGLKLHDIITSMDDKPTPDPQALIDLIGKYNAGDQVTLRLLRNFRPMMIKLHLGTWEGG